ncbi:MAG: DDE-type integrase/transposase/recombinase [Halanaerobium sp.]
MDEEKRRDIALFKYSLIAPLVTKTYTQKSAKDYLEEITARVHDSPRGPREYAPATLKGWLRLYRKYGIDGLYPKIRSDKGKLRKLPDEAKDFIVLAKQANPKRTAKSIYQELIAKGYIHLKDISLSTIQRFISKASISRKKLEPLDMKAFEFEFPNECWQSDVSLGPYLTINGKKRKTYIIAFLDDSSRLLVHTEAFFKENFLSLLSAFKKAVAKRGVPQKLFVDNGKIYKSKQMQLICAALGTVLAYAEPFRPQGKGKVERVFRTLHDQWMNLINWNDFNSLDELNASLYDFVENDYNQTVHSSINAKPIEKFLKYIDQIKMIESKKKLDYMFLYRVNRTVKNDATISLQNILFETPMKYIGDKINLRYDPTSLDKAFIFSDEGKILETIYPVDKIANSKIIRKQNIKTVDFSPFTVTDDNNELF